MTEKIKKCNRDCGQIVVPKDATPEEILKLKRKAADIWEKCSDKNEYGQCKCSLYDFLIEENPQEKTN
ncbi:MAG: hypothetical protein WA152_02670 [Microgenomates group bacterium]